MRRIFAALMLCAAASVAAAQELPSSSLAVETRAGWRTWWRSSAAPVTWTEASPVVRDAMRWRAVQRGVDLAELRLSGSGEAWRIRVIVLRVDPRLVRPQLIRQTRDAGTLGAWAVDSVRPPAVAAVNAGQFSGGTPWGWLVRDGVEEIPPGVGPLSLALVEESGLPLRLVSVDSIETLRARGGVTSAFQSYPTLLESGGVVPHALREGGKGVDVAHRDSRAAIGELSDGRLLVLLTRFEGLGGVLSELPFGPTIPELAALMGALGCREAVALDGGISGQMMVRGSGGIRSWKAFRRVPLGLVLLPR